MAQGGGISVFIGTRGGAIVAAVAAVAVAVALTPVITGGSGGGGATFNLAVLQGTNGVDCDTTPTRVTTAVAGASVPLAATACTFDQAWDAANNSDQIFVRNDLYSPQTVTGDKTANTKFIGESKAGVVVRGTPFECRPIFGADTTFCADGDFLWLQDITLDADTHGGSAIGTYVVAKNVTYKNVDILGDYPDNSIGSGFNGAGCTGCDADNFTWDGGTYGDASPPGRECVSAGVAHGEPNEIYSPGVTIKNITFNKQYVLLETTHGGPCAVGDNGHLEFIRLESGASNLSVVNNRFLCGSDSGSGFIFSSVNPAGSGLKIIGNFFCNNAGSTWSQIPSLACGAVVAHNTFFIDTETDPSLWDTGPGGCDPTWTGNLGNPQGCGGGTHTKNVWSGSGSCGTDTYTGVGSLGLGIDTTGHTAGGSVGVNAGPTSSALSSVDFDGDARPLGAAFDAGADEVG
jgi:hypothetical protein